MCAAFAGIARWEERRLLERFGDDYRANLAEVVRWLPHPPGRWRTRVPDSAAPSPMQADRAGN
jgi:hypothetical protein